MTKYALILPAVVLCGLFVVWPLVELGVLSVQRTNFMTSKFVGFENYSRAFRDATFRRAAINSLLYIALLVVMSVGGALAVTLIAMREGKRWQDATRILLYIPMLAAGVVIAPVWRWLWHMDGPINWIFGLDVVWFGGPQAIFAVSVVVASAQMGAFTVIFLAAVLSIDGDVFEAAIIDGAGWWRIKRSIVLPHIAPTIAVMTLLAAIAAPQIFETIYALAPSDYAASLGFRIYAEAFVFGRHGSAAAQAVLLLFAMVGLTAAKQRIRA